MGDKHQPIGCHAWMVLCTVTVGTVAVLHHVTFYVWIYKRGGKGNHQSATDENGDGVTEEGSTAHNSDSSAAGAINPFLQLVWWK